MFDHREIMSSAKMEHLKLKSKERGERILIVDDSENICKTLSLIFKRKGYDVETVGSGTEAIEKVQDEFFNLALLDIRLTDISTKS
jgi:CheY-like chemotaxis protein